MKMKNHHYALFALATLMLASCGIIGKKDKMMALIAMLINKVALDN